MLPLLIILKMPKPILTAIKLLSTVLISAALGLEIWRLTTQTTLTGNLAIISIIGRVAIAGHLLEGVIIGIKAKSQGRSAITSGIYAFFVGFPSIIETFNFSETATSETS